MSWARYATVTATMRPVNYCDNYERFGPLHAALRGARTPRMHAVKRKYAGLHLSC